MSSFNESAQMIITGSNLNAKTGISYGKIKINTNGGKSLSIISSSSKKLLHVSTPLMMTWGMNVNEFEAGKKTFDMSLQFPREQDSNYSEETVSFMKNLQALESKIKADAVSNGKEWFNKSKMTPEVVDALWSPMLKYPKDPNTDEPDMTRSPTLRVKLDYYDGKFSKDLELYDPNETCIYPPEDEDGNPDYTASPAQLIQKTQNVALVIKCGGIWFVGGKFGVTWKLVQGVVQPRATLRGKCHIKLGGDDRKRMIESTKKMDEENDDEEEVGVEIQDSDEEVEDSQNVAPDAVEEENEEPEEEEQEIEEVTPPPKKKKVVRRKKGSSAEAIN